MLVWVLLTVQVAGGQVERAPTRPCRTEAAIAAARSTIETLDLPALAVRFGQDVRAGCADATIAALYLRGLVAAQEAYAVGGSPESLAPVRGAIATLMAVGPSHETSAEIASAVLQAAAAAAQSEREEMALYLAHALRLEVVERARGRPGAPVVTAHEAAGDLWLRVHRFDDAQTAYDVAAEQVGATPRVILGRARVASRQTHTLAACAAYRTLNDLAGSAEPSAGGRSEIAEARAYLAQPACGRPVPPRR